MWHRLWCAWLGFFYPPHCLVCKTPLPLEPGLCDNCAENAGCGPGTNLQHKAINGVDVYILNDFGECVRKLVHMLKYQGKILPAQIFGEAIGRALLGHLETVLQAEDPWGILPVPLHGARLRERGYNQSALIAQSVGQILGCAVQGRVLVRRCNTPTQTKLDRGARQDNVEGAFEVVNTSWVFGRQVILVDDVATTGATLGACKNVLLDAGAKSVRAVVVAQPDLDADLTLTASLGA